jgi:hypothetical protein
MRSFERAVYRNSFIFSYACAFAAPGIEVPPNEVAEGRG